MDWHFLAEIANEKEESVQGLVSIDTSLEFNLAFLSIPGKSPGGGHFKSQCVKKGSLVSEKLINFPGGRGRE